MSSVQWSSEPSPPPPAGRLSSPSSVPRNRSRSSSGQHSIRSPQEADGSPGVRKEPAVETDWSSPEDISVSEGSDFEDTLKKRPRRSNPGHSKLTQAAKRIGGDENPAKDLFAAMRQSKSAIQILVDDWLDSYKKDRAPALLELINFLIQASGCKGVVTQEMMDSMQNADIIRKMTEDFNEESADYPLSLSTQAWKKFCLNFGEFLDKLVVSCQYNVMYDDILMDTIINLLTGLSDSQVRAFRHTSTFAAMKIMTGMVKAAKDMTHHLETSKRQLDVERGKSPDKRSTERLENLQEKIKELSSYLEDVGNMMNSLFKGVFVHRYRDVHADIRAICIEELGTWIKTYPHSFLNDSYLKYLGWTLHDKQGHVRLQCVRSLQELYTVPGHSGKVELFTSRFKDRVVSMTLDKEPQVAAEAVKLISLIDSNMENIFTAEDYENVYLLVYTTNRSVATAAGAFLYQKFLDVDLDELSPQRRNSRGADTVFFHKLVSFLVRGELHEHAAYLVDSLWDHAGVHLKNWECQTDLLLTEADLNDQEESSLLEILVSSLRQAAEGTSPVGRVPMKKIQSMKDKKLHAEDKIRLSRHMIIALPHLLAKFSADADKMEALLKVVGYLDLEMYSTERLEKYFDLLLTQTREILEKHTDPKVLDGCSCALYILSDRRHNMHKKTDIIVSRLVDGLTDHFLKLLPDVLQVSDLDEDDVYNTAAIMKRLSSLYSAYDLTKWELFEPCSRILQRAVDTGEVPDQIVLPCLVCCHFALLWTLYHLSTAEPSQEEVSALKKKFRLFCSLCQSCLSDLHRSVREQAFILLSDLLVVFNDRLSRGELSHFQPLVYTPDLALQAELAGFLVDHVFTSAEEIEGDEIKQIAMVHNRRNLLAGYCKLILYNILELRYASEVFKYYVKYFIFYGDIIKETLHRSRSVSKEESTMTILLTLTQSFTGFCAENGSPDRRYAQTFLEIRDLARRFSLLLGPDQLRNRQDVLLIHKDGVKFCLRAAEGAAWSPQNLLFLDVLSEFSPKLLQQDKKAVLQYFDEMCTQCIPSDQVYGKEDDDTWAPLHAYKKSLSAAGEQGAPSPSRASSRRGKDRRPDRRPTISPHRKKRRTTDDLEDFSSVIGEDEQRREPVLTSTMLQERSEGSSPAKGKAIESSDSDFDTSASFTIRRPGRKPKEQSEVSSSLQSIMHSLSLMTEEVEEEEEEEEMEIEDVQSSAESTQGEQPSPDLWDSALLDSEE
ncbi:cohesin subunit SA-3 [Hyperolius riggenbachi]|uniref:cohesin subunit SA-3 n=1 Tax=Hyperolius riggenbachi TaxID=752182 RepID=UPI0035A2EF5A